MVNIVCPDCGHRKIGTAEEAEYGPAVAAWCEDPPEMNWPDVFPNKRGLLPFREQKALGYVPPAVSSQTLLLDHLPGDYVIHFNCPKDHEYVLNVAELRAALRNAATKSKPMYLAAHRAA